MFLKQTILKRLMKQAYKSTGLKVAYTEDRLYLAGSYWEMDVLHKHLPKQILAAVIELAGELPDIGQRFSATKEGNQMETALRTEVDIEDFFEGADLTSMELISSDKVRQRVVQDMGHKRVYLINSVFVDIVDNSEINEQAGEYRVNKRKPYTNPAKGILWRNNTTRFHAWWRTDECAERLLQELTMIDLQDDWISEE